MNIKTKIIGHREVYEDEPQIHTELYQKAICMNSSKLGKSHRLTLLRTKELAIALILLKKFREAKKVLNKSIRRA